MISIPSSRLILLASALVPLAVYAAAMDEYTPLLLGFLVIFTLITIDLSVSSNVLKGIRIQWDPVTRMARGLEGKYSIYFGRNESAPQSLRIALAFHRAIEIDSYTRDISIPESDSNLFSAVFYVKPSIRGVFPAPDAFVQCASRLGLFSMRRAYPADAEIRVYPNLHRERKQLANLFMNRGVSGMHLQRQTGQGREYEQLRDYALGDNILDIHWKASAKRGALATKMYQVERTQHVYFILDHSRLSALRIAKDDQDTATETLEENFLERYVTVASVLAMAAEKQGDLFGLVAYGSRVSRFVRANSGRQHSQSVQDALFNLEPEMGPADMSSLFTFLRLRLGRRALLIFMTDLADAVVADEFKKQIALIANNHHVLVNSIRRPGVYPAFSVDYDAPSISQQISGHMRWDNLRKLRADLESKGVQFSLLDHERLSVDIVNQYLSVKQRQVI